ncbi:DnaJ domain-containing protein [Phenylobacterium sp. J426]|uniref:DnaJ domain-containing protein n=1 Tax=Phenylobacterium sp. J426 TaxID=2898439 RepID=UPI0021518E47|nr:DnaJ C-terminal domain-containing protein [Phenylobacterium sp. J426]MCR5872998.1 DnaJ domain-containing protein [Phenylobacterium sp. J426]
MARPRSEMTLKQAREVLGVSSLCTPSEVRAAFREAAKHAHPDAGGSDGAFRQVVEAYRRLRNPIIDDGFAPTPARRAAEPAGDPRLNIPPITALLGGVVEHRLPDGRTLRITLPAGLRCGDKVRAGDARLEIYVKAEGGVLVRGHDLWMTAHLAPATLKKGGRISLDTPLGKRIVWITGKAAERGLVRLEGQGLPARGKHPKGHLFIRLAQTSGAVDSAAVSLLRRFAAAWAA